MRFTVTKKLVQMTICGALALAMSAQSFANTAVKALETQEIRNVVSQVLGLSVGATEAQIMSRINALNAGEKTAALKALAVLELGYLSAGQSSKQIAMESKSNLALARAIFTKNSQPLTIAVLTERYGNRVATDKIASKKVEVSAATADRVNLFSTKLMGGILKDAKPGKNVFITGPAMLGAFTMLANGTSGEGTTEVLKVMGYDSTGLSVLNADASVMVKQLNSKSEAVEMKMANAFFADKDFAVIPAYTQTVKKEFGARAETLDFKRDADGTAAAINGWASDNTAGMIKEIVSPSKVPSLAGILATAIYMKGIWATKFSKEKTRPMTFTLADGSKVQVPMMTGEIDIQQMYGEDYTITRLPYADNSAGMYLILPNDYNEKPISAEQALMKALEAGDLKSFSQNKRDKKGEEMFLPKFAMKYSNAELKDVFQALGVKHIFEAGSLMNLSSDERAKVDYIRMDTALEVDEEGSRAAGVASIGMTLESMHMPLSFDRPFGIVIRDDKSGVELFSGVINNPLEK